MYTRIKVKIFPHFFIVFIGIILFAGCARIEISKSITSYEKVADKVHLGDSKEKVLSILSPSQKNLPPHVGKKPEKYIKDNHLFEIYYMRSSLQEDGLTTDDEFTPYVFKDGKLIAIGWSYLGGAKTQGQSKPTIIAPVSAPAIPTYVPTYKPYNPRPFG